MASEQFSLCWDNFHKNMSAGMNTLLENEEMVDVTLAVEGKYIKAHKMVLSVCSPYFKELFKSSPCQHPIVFMKDVSYVAVSDLLTFMYQGEVQVSQENLTTFIKTAEALQIKGLTGDGNSSGDCELIEAEPEEKVTKIIEHKPGPKSKKHVQTISTSSSSVSPVPAAKRPRLSSQTETPPLTTTLTATKAEVITPTTSNNSNSTTTAEFVQFKMEPYEQTQSFTVPDDSGEDNFGDDAIDDSVDDTEDYTLMENTDEPQAGTSMDGAGEGQDDDSKIWKVKIEEISSSDGKDQISEETVQAVGRMLPKKTLKIYQKEYNCFQRWKHSKNINSSNENVFLEYFSEKSMKVKPPTLWSYYSMLKCMMLEYENCDISKYTKVIALLKKLIVGYKPNKSKTFETDDVLRFLREASDDEYLLMKVVVIMGLYGACRSDELYNLQIFNVIDRQSVIIVTLSDITNKGGRSFCITDSECGVSVLEIVRKYIGLRPKNVPHTKFFLIYRQNKCIAQPVGIHTLYKIPKKIADFLNLPNSEMFTGSCFRRSAALMSANSASAVDLMPVCANRDKSQ